MYSFFLISLAVILYWNKDFLMKMKVQCGADTFYNKVIDEFAIVLLLACSQDWTCNLQMTVSLEA